MTHQPAPLAFLLIPLLASPKAAQTTPCLGQHFYNARGNNHTPTVSTCCSRIRAPAMRSAAQHEEMVATAMIKNQKDFAAGLFYIAIGLFGATTLGENEIGSLSRMGPGYFPLIISTGIILTGLAIAVKSLLLTPALPSEGRIELGRPFSGLLILGSVALYAATLLTLGFVLSISLMVIAASCAHPLFRLRDAVISAVILTTLSALLFVGGLGLIVPMWPTFF